MGTEHLKRRAAERALQFVEPGMKLGLGTGSTVRHLIGLLGSDPRSRSVACVATSVVTEQQARAAGLTLTSLDDVPYLDLTIDGADEIDTELRLIKGGGGALLREKIVATASERFIVIADAGKKVARLGAFPLPVEVVPFGLRATRQMIELLASDVGCTGDVRLRASAAGDTFVTDGGHYILDCAFGTIEDPDALSEALHIVPGVVEHGLFLGLADVAVIARDDAVEVIEAEYEEDE
jgi:ribose 5-phosphate isomerase A